MNKDIPPRNRDEKAAVFLVAGLFVFFLVQAIKKGVMREHGNDLTIYLYASDVFFKGNNPYGIEWGLLYPLFTAFIVEPLNFLPVWAAHMVWYSASFLLLVASLKYSEERINGRDVNRLLLLGTFVFFFGQLQSNFRNGQINIIVLAAIVAFVVFLKGGRPWTASFFLAAGISIKLAPVVLIVFLLVNRMFGIILKTFFWVAVMVFVLPWMVAGGKIVAYYSAYAGVLGASLPDVSTAGNGEWFPAVRTACSLAGLLVAVLCHLAINRRNGGPSYGPFYFYLPILPLAFGNRMEPHYLIWLIPVILAIGHSVFLRPMGVAADRGLMFAFAALAALSNMANQMEAPSLFLAYQLVVFVMAVFWAFSRSGRPAPVGAEL